MTKIGKLWTGAVAYVSLLVGAGLSVAGNLADTYRTRGADVDGLDKVMAAGWPILVLLAIEMFVSPRWSPARLFQVWRWLGCLGVGGMAMVVSWTHLHDLMASRGQLPAVTVLGPLAIDGMAVMATGLILSTRVRGHLPDSVRDRGVSTLFSSDTAAVKLDMSVTDNMTGKLDALQDVTMAMSETFDAGHETADCADTPDGRDRWADLVRDGQALVDWVDGHDRARADIAEELASEAEAHLAAATVTPLPKRTPAGSIYPPEFAATVTEHLSTDMTKSERADFVKRLAVQFDKSERTVRRWLVAYADQRMYHMPRPNSPEES